MSKEMFFESRQNAGLNIPPNHNDMGETLTTQWRNRKSYNNPLYTEWQGLKFILNGQPILTYNEDFMKRYRELENMFG
jgi:hypothetical protein